MGIAEIPIADLDSADMGIADLSGAYLDKTDMGIAGRSGAADVVIADSGQWGQLG